MLCTSCSSSRASAQSFCAQKTFYKPVLAHRWVQFHISNNYHACHCEPTAGEQEWPCTREDYNTPHTTSGTESTCIHKTLSIIPRTCTHNINITTDLVEAADSEDILVIKGRLVVNPLPHLRASNLSCGCILHEVVQRYTAHAA